MNSKNIAKHLKGKLNKWCDSVKDENIKWLIKENAIVTGGALVSLLTGEDPHDYDIYFKTEQACFEVASYYAKVWNETSGDKDTVTVKNTDGRITCFIQSSGIAEEDAEELESDDLKPYTEEERKASKKEKTPYRPKFFSTNAISLSDKIQLVIRFYGDVKEIHKNYDFAHCTCSYDYKTGEVDLPPKALECIINKELHYMGSKYPLCSIIRTRKFIARGYHINAGQYLKMAFQLNELDLKDHNVLYDQLAGVDTAYFQAFLDDMDRMKQQDANFVPDEGYYFEAINRIFG